MTDQEQDNPQHIYAPTFSIDFSPHCEWAKMATGKIIGYRWWVLGPLSFHVMWNRKGE